MVLGTMLPIRIGDLTCTEGLDENPAAPPLPNAGDIAAMARRPGIAITVNHRPRKLMAHSLSRALLQTASSNNVVVNYALTTTAASILCEPKSVYALCTLL
jgi:hypothetical protein